MESQLNDLRKRVCEAYSQGKDILDIPDIIDNDFYISFIYKDELLMREGNLKNKVK